MAEEKTEQKRDEQTKDWVSDLKPGSTIEAKVDKGIEDTFPASDPAPKPVATGFISPSGEDTARPAERAQGYASQAMSQAEHAWGSATATVSQQPLVAIMVTGAVAFVLGILVGSSSRR